MQVPEANPLEFSLDDAVKGMTAWRVGPVRAWLEQRLGPTLPDCVGDLATLEATGWWNTDGAEDVRAATTRLVRAARRAPGTLAPLILFVRFASMLAWEQEWEVDGIRVVAETLGELVDGEDRADPEVGLALALMGLLLNEFDVEAASLGGQLVDWADQAQVCARQAEELVAQVGGQPSGPVQTYVSAQAASEVSYYRAVSDAARAASRIPVDRGASLADAIDRLRRVESVEDPIDRSELRAHRLGLEAMQAALTEPWLQVATGRVVCLFPFALRGVSDHEVLDRLEDVEEWLLAGVPVVSHRQSLPINDMWHTQDPLGRGFRGAALRLPEVVLPRAGKPDLVLHPEIWLSALGNHVLRLEGQLVDADPFDLEHVLRVFGPEGADLDGARHTLRSVLPPPHDRSWTSPASLADAVLTDLAQRLSPPSLRPVHLVFVQSLVTNVMIVDQARGWCPATAELHEVDDAAQVRLLFGSQLLTQPMGILTSIGQWARTDTGPVLTEITGAGRGSWIAQSENSASVVAFGIPSYAVDMLTDCVVFTASLSGLFAGWNHDLATFNGELAGDLARISEQLATADEALTSQQVRVVEHDLETRQLRLHDFVTRCRAVIFFVESPTLLSSPIMRSLIDRLLDSADYQRLVKGFNDSAAALAGGRLETVLGKVRARLEKLEEKEATRRDRKIRIVTDALLAGVAVAGISGVASLIQAGYDMGPAETVLMVLLVAILSILIGIAVWLSSRRD